MTHLILDEYPDPPLAKSLNYIYALAVLCALKLLTIPGYIIALHVLKYIDIYHRPGASLVLEQADIPFYDLLLPWRSYLADAFAVTRSSEARRTCSCLYTYVVEGKPVPSRLAGLLSGFSSLLEAGWRPPPLTM